MPNPIDCPIRGDWCTQCVPFDNTLEFVEGPTHFYVEYGAQWGHRVSEDREVRIEIRV